MTLGLEPVSDRPVYPARGLTRDPVTIRTAQNSDGLKIRDLVLGSGFNIPVSNWGDIFPYWLIAEIGKEPVGCIQVCPGKPMGRLEMLSLKSGLSHREKAVAVRDLVACGAGILARAGSEVASGMVPFELKDYKKILKKHGCQVGATGNLLVKSLRD